MSKRTTRRVPVARRIEVLEARALLSVGASAAFAVDPAISLLVRFEAGASAVATGPILESLGARVVSTYPDGTDLVALAGGVGQADALARLRANPIVDLAEPNARLEVSRVVPDDPSFARQWGLDQSTDVDINAPEAWGLAAGLASTIVAVLDTGIDLDHPDLMDQLWHDPATGESGWNFVANTADVQDDNGHGTHVSGIIAASVGNGVGVAGVDGSARLMPLKIMGADGNGSLSAAVAAVYYAADHGARVINASWTSPVRSQALADAIRYAGGLGAVFVAAAGNASADDDVNPLYPAAEPLTNIISVAAVGRSGNLASFSNFGVTSVDIGAPGVGILSTLPGGYGTLSGTSMATPMVSGVVALVLGQEPSLGAEQAIRRVLSTARPLDGLQGRTVTGGMVDAAAALAAGRIAVAGLVQGVPEASLVLQRPDTGDWLSLDPGTGATRSIAFGGPGLDAAVPADFDGDGRLNYAVYRPSTGQWFALGAGGTGVIAFGAPDLDLPYPADYDGDGKADIAVYRPTTGEWFVLGSRAGFGTLRFGIGGLDVAVPADYDGDGKADIAVYRPTTGEWFVLGSRSGFGSLAFGLGDSDVPVPADYDGDGKADLAIFRPSTAEWSLLESTAGFWSGSLGAPGSWVPAPGDYDGDGRVDVAAYLPAAGLWSIFRTSDGPLTQLFGAPGQDVPIGVAITDRLPSIVARSPSADDQPTGAESASFSATVSSMIILQALDVLPDRPADVAHPNRISPASPRGTRRRCIELG